MAKITIDMEQGHDRHARREGRLLRFPDGMERIIALPHRSWLMFDQLADRWVYPGLYETECFEIAKQYGDPGDDAFEEAIVYLLGLAIESGWAVLNEEVRACANQNSDIT